MPEGNKKAYNCILCSKRTNPKNRRPMNESFKSFLAKKFLITASDRDVLCNTCRHKYYIAETKTVILNSNLQHGNDVTEQTDPDYVPEQTFRQHQRSAQMASPPSIAMNIPSTPKSRSRCFICKRPGPKLVVIASDARFAALLESNVIIAAGSRCCPVHIQDQKLLPAALKDMPTLATTYLNRSMILDLLSSMRNTCLRTNNRFNFDSLNDTEYSEKTGLKREDFDDLCTLVDGHIRNTPSRSIRTTVGIFLLKLKSGMSNKLIGTLFGISKSSIRRAITSVRQILMKTSVPKHLGLHHIAREVLINTHTRPLAQSLFGTDESGEAAKLILVLDGTYIYIQKSNNFLFQRRSYNMHKGRPLVKPMVVVSTTGYFVTIVGIVGPYLSDSKNNDARILNHMLMTNIEDIKSYIQPEDVYIVDRGFRDAVEWLANLGIKAEMQSFMTKGQKQMPTEDANSSRLVTKIRWVVESANSRIKRWKYLDRVQPTNQVPYIGDYVKIVCAISNKYLSPLCCSDNADEDKRIASHMLKMSKQVNVLKSEIEDRNLERRSTIWKAVSEVDLDHFPRLSEDQLRSLTCGVYQLKLSSSYVQEHLDGNCNIQIHTEESGLIRVRLQSRHVSAKQYVLWLRFDPAEVTAWYCKCRAGSRVVGVCSHIASIIWYLGYARYRYVDTRGFGVRNWGENLLDASNIPEAIDASDSGSEACDSD